LSISRARVWLLASRPKTLPAAVAPVVIGTAMAVRDGAFHAMFALAALVGAVLIQIGTNLANDYADFRSGVDSGERLGPMRVTQAGLVTPTAIKRATALVFCLALLIGIHLVWRGGWPVVIIGLSSILFGILYTAGPYPLGYNGLGDVFVLIFFGPVAVAGTYYVQALDAPLPVMIAGLAPGLFSVGILTVNNLRDIDNDIRAGKRTLPARFGRTFARWEYAVCVLAASILPSVLWLTGVGGVSTLLTLLVPLAALPVLRTVKEAYWHRESVGYQKLLQLAVELAPMDPEIQLLWRRRKWPMWALRVWDRLNIKGIAPQRAAGW